MYRTFMNRESHDSVSRALLCLAKDVEFSEGDGSFWICHGSFVLSRQTSESDLDLLYIHNRPLAVQRIQTSFEGHSVALYSLSRNDFASDGEQRRFGGYLSGKVLSPYTTFFASQQDQKFVAKVAGAFIGPFAAAVANKLKRKTATPANLVADSVFARFHLCPWYRSYFLRYYSTPFFLQLWQKMEEAISLAFMEAGIVVQDGSYFYYRHSPSDEELHEETIAATARFWSIGSYLHGGMPDFPSYYIQKAEEFIRKNNLESRYEEMMQFLLANQKETSR